MVQSRQVGMTLVVDVDGTLIKSNLLIESALKFIKQSPLAILWMVRWLLLGGKARLKSRIAERGEVDIAHMPFCAEIVALRRQARQQGRRVVLATGAANSAAGRGYQTRYIPVLLAQGAASGQLAVLVFALRDSFSRATGLVAVACVTIAALL